MKFNNNSLECLRNNFEEMILSDKILIQLYFVASNFDTERECPTFWGNLHNWIDIKSDDWLAECWQDIEDIEYTLPIDERMSLKEKHELVRKKLMDELKEIIDSEILY